MAAAIDYPTRRSVIRVLPPTTGLARPTEQAVMVGRGGEFNQRSSSDLQLRSRRFRL